MASIEGSRPDVSAERRREAIAQHLVVAMHDHPEENRMRRLWRKSTDRVNRVITANVSSVIVANSIGELRDLAQWQFDAHNHALATHKIFDRPADSSVVSNFYQTKVDYGVSTTRFVDRAEEIEMARHLREQLDRTLHPPEGHEVNFDRLRRRTAVLLTMLDVAVHGQPFNATQNLRARLKATQLLTEAAFETVEQFATAPTSDYQGAPVTVVPSRERVSPAVAQPQQRIVFDTLLSSIDDVLDEPDQRAS